MAITIFENIQEELRIDAETGVGYCSIRGAATIAGVDESTLREQFKSAGLEPSKLAESLVEKGFEGAELASFAQTGIPDLALAVILEYYAMYAGRHCNPTARVAYDSFAAIGIRTVIQNACRYEELVKQAIALPPSDVRLYNMIETLKFLEIDVHDPRFKRGLQGLVVNMLGIAQPTLSPDTMVYLGVVDKAEELGYPIALVNRFRSQLGKYVASIVASIGLPSREEKRLCNGMHRSINVYLDSPELSVAVREFMDAKVLAAAES